MTAVEPLALEAFEQRVRCAIAANVDLMSAPPRVIERTMTATRRAENRRRRRRRVAAVVTALAFASAVVGAAANSGWRPSA